MTLTVAPEAPLPLGGVAALSHGLDVLAATEVDRLSGTEQAGLLREVARAESRLAGFKARLLAAAERSSTARKAGAADTAAWSAGLVKADPVRAAREVRLAQGLESRTRTQEALAGGVVSVEHAAVIVDADRRLPDRVSASEREQIETHLLDKCTVLTPGQLRRAARRALEAVESDPRVVDAEENRLVRDEEATARAKTRLTLHENADGTVSGHFTIPTVQGHLLRKILASMTAPRRTRPGASTTQGGGRVEPDHARGLAFCELLDHLPTDRLPTKTAATIVVTMSIEALTGALDQVGRLDSGTELSAGETRRIACGAGIIPAVLGSTSVPLDLGRSTRLFTETQRTALATRYETCAADGCERPFSWCELHHQDPWSHGGPTDLANAEPLCAFHHHRIHDPTYHHTRTPDGTVRFARAHAGPVTPAAQVHRLAP